MVRLQGKVAKFVAPNGQQPVAWLGSEDHRPVGSKAGCPLIWGACQHSQKLQKAWRFCSPGECGVRQLPQFVCAFLSPRCLQSLQAGVLACLVLFTGCEKEEEPAPSGPPLPGQTVELVVVDDPELADAAGQLATEWKSRTGAELKIRQVASSELASAELPDAGVVIYPSALLGELQAHPQVQPRELAETTLAIKPLAWEDIFNTNRLRESRWDGDPVAIPVGSPVLVCYYRPNILEKAGLAPPETWTKYAALAERLQTDENLRPEGVPAGDWYGTAEPRGPGSAGLMLLARAAGYAKHPDYYSTLFDIESMEPLIAGPAFERALDELTAAWKFAVPADVAGSPEDCTTALRQGRCGLALGWASRRTLPADQTAVPCAVTLLPGTQEVFNAKDQEFRRTESVRRVPLVGWSGRLASIIAKSGDKPSPGTQPPGSSTQPQADGAELLVTLLLGEEWGTQFSSASLHTTLFRQKQIPRAADWMALDTKPELAESYALAMAESLSAIDVLYAVRIPGRNEYLQALDEAVAAATSGKSTSREALTAAAQKWRDITQKLGVDEQRELYRQSVMGNY